jgi:hypothetical protein
VEEIAEVVKVSPIAPMRDRNLPEDWLCKELRGKNRDAA